jgi:hypothetical protein
MGSLFKGRFSVVPLVTLSAIALLVGGASWALAAGGGSKIHACASKKTGALRVVRKCTKKERPVVWNLKGPRGLRGPRGRTGAVGARGVAGVQGPQGPGAAAIQFFALPAGSTGAATPVATIGPWQLTARCVLKGGGAVEALVAATNSDGWDGYDTITTQTILPSTGTATTTLGSPTVLNDTGQFATDLAPSGEAVQLGGEFDLHDLTTNHVLDVHLTLYANASTQLCNGVGAAIPAT